MATDKAPQASIDSITMKMMHDLCAEQFPNLYATLKQAVNAGEGKQKIMKFVRLKGGDGLTTQMIEYTIDYLMKPQC